MLLVGCLLSWIILRFSAAWIRAIVGLSQMNIRLIFSLNWWFMRANINGLSAELNTTIVSAIATWRELMSRDVYALKKNSTDSVPQQIPKRKLTVTTIKVARLRLFMTPCVKKKWIMESNEGRCNICGDTFVAGGDLTHRTSDYHTAAVREYESALLSPPVPRRLLGEIVRRLSALVGDHCKENFELSGS